MKIAAFFLLLGFLNDQTPTLQRRSEPPPIGQKSCRDHVEDVRKDFVEAMPLYEKGSQKKMHAIEKDLRHPRTVEHICTSDRLVNLLDLFDSLALYSIAAAKKGK